MSGHVERSAERHGARETQRSLPQTERLSAARTVSVPTSENEARRGDDGERGPLNRLTDNPPTRSQSYPVQRHRDNEDEERVPSEAGSSVRNRPTPNFVRDADSYAGQREMRNSPDVRSRQMNAGKQDMHRPSEPAQPTPSANFVRDIDTQSGQREMRNNPDSRARQMNAEAGDMYKPLETSQTAPSAGPRHAKIPINLPGRMMHNTDIGFGPSSQPRGGAYTVMNTDIPSTEASMQYPQQDAARRDMYAERPASGGAGRGGYSPNRNHRGK